MKIIKRNGAEEIFDRKKMAANPLISVILDVKEDAVRETLDSIYMQSMPRFEIFVRESKTLTNDFPDRWRECPNLRILRDDDFKATAKAMARSEKILKIYRPMKADPRVFRFILRLPIPERIKNTAFTLLFRAVQTAVRIKKNG